MISFKDRHLISAAGDGREGEGSGKQRTGVEGFKTKNFGGESVANSELIEGTPVGVGEVIFRRKEIEIYS